MFDYLGVLLQPAELEAVVDCLRSHVQWPIRPSSSRQQPDAIDFSLAGPADHNVDIFAWVWLPLPLRWYQDLVSRPVLPLPIVSLRVPLCGFFLYVSLSALWHVLPLKRPPAQTFTMTNQALWAFLRDYLGLSCEQLIPSRMAIRARDPKAEVPPYATNMFLCSLPFLLGILAWYLRRTNQPLKFLEAIFGVQRCLCSSLVLSMHYGGRGLRIVVQSGMVPVAEVIAALQWLRLESLWDDRVCLCLPVLFVLWLPAPPFCPFIRHTSRARGGT